MRNSLLKLFFISIFGFVLLQTWQTGYSNNPGAPAKRTGSPGDGQSCSTGSGCHGGNPIPTNDLITSDVPVSGYIPDSVYTITASVSQSGIAEFGFEISPQNEEGDILGTIIVTDPSRTHLTLGNSGYITHTTSGANGNNNSNTWQFDWKAPAAGTGNVTFYGAFNYTNSNNLSTGDAIHTSFLTVPENNVGIGEALITTSLNIYPNPSVSEVCLIYYLQKPGNVTVTLFNENGTSVRQNLHLNQSTGKQNMNINLENIPSGIYILQMQVREEIFTRKLVKL